jgi:plastocyanin
VTRRAATALLVVALATLGLTAGVAAAAPDAPRAHVTARVPAPHKTVTIHIRDNLFEPAALNVEEGTTVRWINDGRNTHNVTPDTGKAYGSPDLKPGRSYVHTFTDPGTFAYYCTLHGTPTSGQRGQLGVGDESAATPQPIVGSSDAPAPSYRASGRTIRVPADAKTIQAGVDKAKPGDLVLVSPGVYKESVTIGTDGVVLRGVDRNRTILDGEFERDNGVFVVGADGVAVENLTARNFTENGFFWNGVLGYRGSYLTAYRNGDYGVYAYDSQYGMFDHSYASGSPDSGFYIGQCNPCHAVITDVVSQYNLLGYSGSNSSGDLSLVNSEWSRNRTGIVPNSFGAEELSPQGQATIAGNVVSDNGDPGATRGNEAAYDPAFGVGIVIAGGQQDVVTKNRVTDNDKVGIALAPSVGLEDVPHQPRGNQVTDNVIEGSGMVDLGVVLTDASDQNCFSGNTFTTSAPANIEQAAPCSGAGTGDFTTGAVDLQQFLDTTNNAKGVGYKQSPVPKRQRNMPRATSAKARPAGAPPAVDLAAIEVPSGG